MAYEYSDLVSDIEHWAQQSVKQGWINNEQAEMLSVVERTDANVLFSQNIERPLVVAFMGGTGVGKSSLLNKLAGQSVAKTGVERPTSREVTLYHHLAVQLDQLDDKFPLQDIQIARHENESNKKTLWIDMPDFDSTEQKNKDIVMQWLPYVDVLVYVVSPERYRDNKAWELLLAESASHAWLFVMNQWDRGETSQFEDFKLQLSKAGFENPIIFKTSCIDQTISDDDEVPKLQKSIATLAGEKTVVQLELRGAQQRNDNIKQKLALCLQNLGQQQQFASLQEYQSQSWAETEKVLTQGFEWPIKQASLLYADAKIITPKDQIKLWDEWSQSRFNDHLDDLILKADQQGLPSKPLRNALAVNRSKAADIVHAETELGCRKALINPGNVFQRVLLKTAKISELVLPMAAMSIVGYQVFQGFYDSAVTDEAFLGVDFAVHSSLLILISWLLPFFIRKKMQPSLEKAALKGIYNGWDVARSAIELDIKTVIDQFELQHQGQIQAVTRFIAVCDQQSEINALEPRSGQLKRMLVEKK